MPSQGFVGLYSHPVLHPAQQTTGGIAGRRDVQRLFVNRTSAALGLNLSRNLTDALKLSARNEQGSQCRSSAMNLPTGNGGVTHASVLGKFVSATRHRGTGRRLM